MASLHVLVHLFKDKLSTRGPTEVRWETGRGHIGDPAEIRPLQAIFLGEDAEL